LSNEDNLAIAAIAGLGAIAVYLASKGSKPSPTPTCPIGQHWDTLTQACIADNPTPNPNNMEPMSVFLAHLWPYSTLADFKFQGWDVLKIVHEGSATNRMGGEIDGDWVGCQEGDILNARCNLKGYSPGNTDLYGGIMIGIDFYVRDPQYGDGVAAYSDGNQAGKSITTPYLTSQDPSDASNMQDVILLQNFVVPGPVKWAYYNAYGFVELAEATPINSVVMWFYQNANAPATAYYANPEMYITKANSQAVVLTNRVAFRKIP